MPDITHIRGDTFTVAGQFGPSDFTGWTGRSQVRGWDDDEKYSDLTFAWSDASQGLFSVEVKDTSNWPALKYVAFDVQITSPVGVVKSSARVKIYVEKDVTYDAAN